MSKKETEKLDAENSGIHIEGNVTGGILNIGGRNTFHGNIDIRYDKIDETHKNSINTEELKSHLEQLQEVLETIKNESPEDVELVQEYTNDIINEITKDNPRKKKLEITGENLKKAAENLLLVSPIVVKISNILLQLSK